MAQFVKDIVHLPVPDILHSLGREHGMAPVPKLAIRRPSGLLPDIRPLRCVLTGGDQMLQENQGVAARLNVNARRQPFAVSQLRLNLAKSRFSFSPVSRSWQPQ